MTNFLLNRQFAFVLIYVLIGVILFFNSFRTSWTRADVRTMECYTNFSQDYWDALIGSNEPEWVLGPKDRESLNYCFISGADSCLQSFIANGDWSCDSGFDNHFEDISLFATERFAATHGWIACSNELTAKLEHRPLEEVARDHLPPSNGQFLFLAYSFIGFCMAGFYVICSLFALVISGSKKRVINLSCDETP